MTFTPRVNPISGKADGYDFEASTRFDKLFTGIAVERPAWPTGSRAGYEDIGPEGTVEGDYGRLLEAAFTRKGWCARRGLTPYTLSGSVLRAA